MGTVTESTESTTTTAAATRSLLMLPRHLPTMLALSLREPMLQLPKQTETSVLFQPTTFCDDLKETLYNHSSILFATEMLHHVPLFQVAKVYSFLNILPN